MGNVFIDSHLWFFKLKLVILCSVDTHSRKVYYASRFEVWKLINGGHNKSGEMG